ncbi:peptidylprolyl isomerase [Patescibacteria group bacterium]|nr:MAG: peptidylprolyl isomerase [Patescibacteria group bacterium]
MTSSRRLSLGLAGLLLLGAGCAPVGSPAGLSGSDAVEITLPPASVPTQPEPTPVVTEQPATLTAPGVLPDAEITGKVVRIHTEKGDITFELYPKSAPLAVSNMAYLAGLGFYDGVTFHRRVEGFVIQGGDPYSRTLPPGDPRIGTGGPGYRFADELKDDFRYDRGIVAMANSGTNTNGSQFFIMLADYPLPKNYTIFGKVLSGMDVVDKIKVGDKMVKVTVEDKK